MRSAEVYFYREHVGKIVEIDRLKKYAFEYDDGYDGPGISVTLPSSQKRYTFDALPSFFEGLLPEGANLEVLLRTKKIDRNDAFSQLLAVGEDTVGAVTIREES